MALLELPSGVLYELVTRLVEQPSRAILFRTSRALRDLLLESAPHITLGDGMFNENAFKAALKMLRCRRTKFSLELRFDKPDGVDEDVGREVMSQLLKHGQQTLVNEHPQAIVGLTLNQAVLCPTHTSLLPECFPALTSLHLANCILSFEATMAALQQLQHLSTLCIIAGDHWDPAQLSMSPPAGADAPASALTSQHPAPSPGHAQQMLTSATAWSTSRSVQEASETNEEAGAALLSIIGQLQSLKTLKLHGGPLARAAVTHCWALAPLAPHLQHLELQPSKGSVSVSDAADMGYEVAATFTALTSLQLPYLDQSGLDAILQHLTNLRQLSVAIEPQALTASRAQAPCSWQQLALLGDGDTVHARVLALLPLHSLTQPLQLPQCARLDGRSACRSDLADALETNLGRLKQGMVWSQQGCSITVFDPQSTLDAGLGMLRAVAKAGAAAATNGMCPPLTLRLSVASQADKRVLLARLPHMASVSWEKGSVLIGPDAVLPAASSTPFPAASGCTATVTAASDRAVITDLGFLGTSPFQAAAHLQSLQRLHVAHLDSQDLQHITCLTHLHSILTELHLSSSTAHWQDDVLQPICSLTGLRDLSLALEYGHTSDHTDQSVMCSIASALTQLTRLELRHNVLSQRGLDAILQHLQHLKHLTVMDVRGIDADRSGAPCSWHSFTQCGIYNVVDVASLAHLPLRSISSAVLLRGRALMLQPEHAPSEEAAQKLMTKVLDNLASCRACMCWEGENYVWGEQAGAQLLRMLGRFDLSRSRDTVHLKTRLPPLGPSEVLALSASEEQWTARGAPVRAVVQLQADALAPGFTAAALQHLRSLRGVRLGQYGPCLAVHACTAEERAD